MTHIEDHGLIALYLCGPCILRYLTQCHRLPHTLATLAVSSETKIVNTTLKHLILLVKSQSHCRMNQFVT